MGPHGSSLSCYVKHGIDAGLCNRTLQVCDTCGGQTAHTCQGSRAGHGNPLIANFAGKINFYGLIVQSSIHLFDSYALKRSVKGKNDFCCARRLCLDQLRSRTGLDCNFTGCKSRGLSRCSEPPHRNPRGGEFTSLHQAKQIT